MTDIEQEARAEAFKRYDGDRIIDERTGDEVPHDDWGYAESDRRAFVEGVRWAASRPATRETVTEEMVERAAERLYRAFTSNMVAEWDDVTDESDEPRSAYLEAASEALEAALAEGNAD